MADSLFISAFNDGNLRFGVDCGEQFELVTGATTTPLMALSIDEVVNEDQIIPGGILNMGDIILFVLKSVWDGAGVQDGAKLIIRGNRFRFNSPADDGDNTYRITCGPIGVKV